MSSVARTRRGFRLAKGVVPESIDLHFDFDPESPTFRGTAGYALRIARRRETLELHSAELDVSEVRIHTDGAYIEGRAITDPGAELVRLEFDRPIPSGEARLELTFSGRVRDDLRGVYSATTEGVRWLATQLCPTDARRAFPCFDEPGIKARYRITVTAPAGLTVLSNAPRHDRESTSDGRVTHRFEATPPLSSYLIAVAVGPFEASPLRRVGATEIRVFTLPDQHRLAHFAADAAAESLERLEAWFDMPHPYPKLDLVALPAFAFGAMENAGAVFFRDSILLVDAENARMADLVRSAEVIAHELAHMWFGNLVTMGWWNDLWLNEAFATWMAYVIVDDWQPEWRIWLDFSHRREQALEMDALSSSHPIAPPIRDADEAQENFDAITYTKGACVLRMLERYLGAETFREGIRLYIRRHRESNATAADLWAALAEVSGEPVEEIIGPWTSQTGYPLIRVDLEAPGTDRARIQLEQSRFLALDSAKVEGESWPVPWVGRIGRVEASGPDSTREVRTPLRAARDHVSGLQPDEAWLYGNAAEGGFFRLEHDRDALRRLLDAPDRMSPAERIGLIGHQWALTRSGRADLGVLFDLVTRLANDPDPEVLLALESPLTRLARRLVPSQGNGVETRFRAWVAELFQPTLEGMGLDEVAGESLQDSVRRARLLALVGGIAHAPSVLDACAERTEAFLSDRVPIAASLADEVLRLAALVGDHTLHARLNETVRQSETPQERRRALIALASFHDPALLEHTLAASLDATLAPISDRAQLLSLLLVQAGTSVTTWGWLQQEWPRLQNELPPILLARLVEHTSEALPTDLEPELIAFFEKHPLAAGDRALRQVSEEFAIARRFEAEAGPALAALLSAD